MKQFSMFSAACVAAALSTTWVQAADQWQDLFDGKTLNGWVQRGGKAKYTVEDGCIVGASVTNTPNSFLCTEKDYGDFTLELEFKVDPKLNSGVQIRSDVFPDARPLNIGGKEIKLPPDRRSSLPMCLMRAIRSSHSATD